MQHKEDRSAGQKAMPTLRAWFERGTGQPPLSASACLADVATLSEPAALLRAIERATQAAGEDGACALIISAMDSIVLHGRDCARLLPWIAAADELLTRQPGPAPVARAALALQRLVAALLAGASLDILARQLAEIRLDIFRCDSAPLKVRLAGVEVYLHLFLGNLHRRGMHTRLRTTGRACRHCPRSALKPGRLLHAARQPPRLTIGGTRQFAAGAGAACPQ